MIILLDGSKGAGKSSVSKILRTHIHNVVCLSIDDERHALPGQGKSLTERNAEAFEHIVEKVKKSIESGSDIIIDCGLTEERVLRLDMIAQRANAQIYKFFLSASHDTLLKRVHIRDRVRGKTTDTKRFEEVYEIIHSKKLGDYNVIETDKLSAEEVVGMVLAVIR